MIFASRLALLSALIIISLIGCSRSGDSSSPAPSSAVEELFHRYGYRWNNMTELSCDTKQEGGDPFACLRKACTSAEGEFNEENKSCTCTKGLGFSATYGQCLPLIPERLQPKVPATQIRVVVSPEPNSPTAFDLASLIDQDYTQVSTLNFPILTHFALTLKLASPRALSEEDLVENLRRDPTLDNKVYSQTDEPPLLQTEAIYNSPEEELLARLNAYTPKPDTSLKNLPPSSALLELAQDLDRWSIKENRGSEHVRTQSANGCAGICTIDSLILNPNFEQARFMVDHRLILDGLTYSHMLFWANNEDGQAPLAAVKLDFSGQPNLIYLIDYQRSANHITVTANIFSRNGELLFADAKVLDQDIVKVEDAKAASRSTVMICENGFPPYTKVSPLAGKMVTGPSLPNTNNFSGSLWGWIENKDASPDLFFSGAQSFGRVGFVPSKLNLVLSQHNADVATTVVQSYPEATISNLGLDQCTSQDPARNPLLRRDYPGMAINLSAGNFADGDACEDILSAIQKTSGQRLWLVAAGNEQGISSCDARIRKLQNVVSVGAMDQNQTDKLADYSLGAEKNVQIAAALLNDEHSGTSFTAPVAAAMVAEVATNYPGLSPALVKRALLLGTDFLNLPIASGGRMNADFVRKVAKLLSQDSSLSSVDILTQIYNLPTVQTRLSQVDQDMADCESRACRAQLRKQKSKYSKIVDLYKQHSTWIYERGI